MKIEDQVVSLKLAKQLKQLGVEQYSLFHWCKNIELKDKDFKLEYGVPTGTWRTEPSRIWLDGEMYHAYTFAEISNMLPATLECNDDPYEPCDGIYIQIGREKNGTWNCNDGDFYAQSKRIADAPAKMILYLLSEDCYYDDKKFLEWKDKLLGN